jgi:outer membrane biosynthesis protein TonB
MKIGGAAAIVIVAAFGAVAFYANRVATSAAKKEGPAVTITTPVAAPMSAKRSDESDAAPAKTEAPSILPVEATSAVKETQQAPTAEAPVAPEATVQPPTAQAVAPAKDTTPVRKRRAAATPAPAPAPVESPSPQPVAAEPPAPAPAPAPAPPPEPARVERVACADSSNPFSREACLWQECAKPEFRSHAECARFTGPGGLR